jgi:hypothetical protein
MTEEKRNCFRNRKPDKGVLSVLRNWEEPWGNESLSGDQWEREGGGGAVDRGARESSE